MEAMFRSTVAILPSTDLDRTAVFYQKVGFRGVRAPG
jgi:hypothetical protein